MTTNLEDLETILTRRRGKSIASIPELRLIATADNDAGALTALDAKRRVMLADLAEAGLLDELEAELDSRKTSRRKHILNWTSGAKGPGGSRSNSSLAHSALRTFVNTMVVVAVLVGGLVTGGFVLADRAEIALAKAKLIVGSQKVGGAAFWAELETKLHNNASPQNDLSEEKKQRFLADLRVLVNRARPFVHEAMLVFTEPDAQPKNGAAANK